MHSFSPILTLPPYKVLVKPSYSALLCTYKDLGFLLLRISWNSPRESSGRALSRWHPFSLEEVMVSTWMWQIGTLWDAMLMRSRSRHSINQIKPAINLKAIYSPKAYTPVLVHKHKNVLLITELSTYICHWSLLGLFQTWRTDAAVGQVLACCHDPLPMETKYDTHSHPEATFLLVIHLSQRDT